MKNDMNSETQKMYNLAKSYKALGWSIIPVSKSKKPLISWKEYQTRIADDSEIYEWFMKYPEAQIGIITGKISNLIVVDVEKGGDPSFLPQNTTIIQSGNKGYHYYFKFEEGVKNSARIKELVDIRGTGGYVVSPNSVSDKGPYTMLQDKPLLPFPKDLFPKKVDIFSTPERGGGSSSFNNSEVDSYPGYVKGCRNDETARYIGHVLAKTHPADWETKGWDIIQKANLANTPPLAPRELLNTFNSIKDIERRSNPLDHSQVNFGASKGISASSSYAEEPNVIPDDGDDEIMHIADAAEAQKINPDDVYPLGFEIFDEVILGGVCPGDVITIAGQPSHGKTSLCQDFTISMLRSEKAPKALWFSYEVLATHLWTKFKEMGMTREDCAFIPVKHSTGNIEWVEKKIKEGKEKFGIKLVFIDHMGFLLPKTKGILGKNMSSNYSTFLTQIMRDLKTIAIKEEVIIFLPVHMKKPNLSSKLSEIEDISGSNGPAQESDLVFIIERVKETDKTSNRMFKGETKISLAKNRKTGISLRASFNMLNGRFEYDPSPEQAQKDFEEIGKDIDEIAEEKKKAKLEEKKEVKKEIDLADAVQSSWKETMNN